MLFFYLFSFKGFVCFDDFILRVVFLYLFVMLCSLLKVNMSSTTATAAAAAAAASASSAPQHRKWVRLFVCFCFCAHLLRIQFCPHNALACRTSLPFPSPQLPKISWLQNMVSRNGRQRRFFVRVWGCTCFAAMCQCIVILFNYTNMPLLYTHANTYILISRRISTTSQP